MDWRQSDDASIRQFGLFVRVHLKQLLLAWRSRLFAMAAPVLPDGYYMRQAMKMASVAPKRPPIDIDDDRIYLNRLVKKQRVDMAKSKQVLATVRRCAVELHNYTQWGIGATMVRIS